MQPTVDPKKVKADVIVLIGDIKVVVEDVSKRLMVSGKSVNPSVQRLIMPNYHRANSSSSASKYFQPMWYPLGLTCTQKKKLQRLRFQEKREQEIKKSRDKQFNQCGPMVSQGKVRRVKAAD